MSERISLTRQVRIPDPYKLERYRRAPELGPNILFFSGGTALRDVSSQLVGYTHNSIHLITPFDSGGSSAKLRHGFAMPAVGDIRNRLMALADQSIKGNPEIFALFTHRLAREGDQAALRKDLERMADGEHLLVRWIPEPMREIIRNQFHIFLEKMPADFDLRGASIGNIVLTAGYLANRRKLDPVIYIYSKLVQVRGVVRPTVNMDVHLAAQLADGQVVVGEHLMTAKDAPHLASPITDFWLTASLDSREPVRAAIQDQVRERIAEADLICYPIGSFYSSVVANLLPDGVGRAVADNACPKVFIPNTGVDPEARGMSVADQVAVLLKHLKRSGATDRDNVLDLVIVDTRGGEYPGGLDREGILGQGVKLLDVELTTDPDSPRIDPLLLSETLCSLT